MWKQHVAMSNLDNVRIIDLVPIGATELAVGDAFPTHQGEEHSFESQHWRCAYSSLSHK